MTLITATRSTTIAYEHCCLTNWQAYPISCPGYYSTTSKPMEAMKGRLSWTVTGCPSLKRTSRQADMTILTHGHRHRAGQVTPQVKGWTTILRSLKDSLSTTLSESVIQQPISKGFAALSPASHFDLNGTLIGLTVHSVGYPLATFTTMKAEITILETPTGEHLT